MRATYHDDAIDNHGMFNGPIDEFIKFCRQHHERYDMFMHLLGSPNIDVDGSKAFAETYCLLIQRMKPQKTYNADVALHVMAGSRFLDRFEKRNGLWKVSERQVIVEWFRNEWSWTLRLPARGVEAAFGNSGRGLPTTRFSGCVTASWAGARPGRATTEVSGGFAGRFVSRRCRPIAAARVSSRSRAAAVLRVPGTNASWQPGSVFTPTEPYSFHE